MNSYKCISQIFFTLLGTALCGNPNTEPVYEKKTDDCNTTKAVKKPLQDVRSVTSLKSDQRDLQQRLTQVEEKQGSAMPQISCGKTLFVTC